MLFTDDAPRPLMPTRRGPIVPNGVLGMLLFIVAEVMFFAGLISAFMIVKSNAISGWPPPGQPRLPAAETAINTAALLLSAATLYFAHRDFKAGLPRAKSLLLATLLLGAFFFAFQGAEWIALLRQGLTLTSSTHGSFFYLIVGTHGLHALVALAVLLFTYRKLKRGDLDRFTFVPAQLFWYFVVAMWPIIYWRVYL